jgi:hypothetical protein
MEAQKTNPLKTAMTYGIFLSGISIVISIIIWAGNLMEFMGLFGSVFIGLLQPAILVFLLVYFTKQYRNNSLDGKIGFGQAFTFGVLLVVFSSIINSLYSYIFNKFIDPEYVTRTMTMIQEKTYQWMTNNRMPEDKIEEAMSGFEKRGIPSPIETLMSSLKFGLIGGAIMSLISSAIVKKNVQGEDAFDQAMEDVKTED